MRLSPWSLASFLLLVAGPSAQTIRIVLEDGDGYFPYGGVVGIGGSSVDEDGTWTAVVNMAREPGMGPYGCIVQGDRMLYAPGTPLLDPADGAFLQPDGSIGMSARGSVVADALIFDMALREALLVDSRVFVRAGDPASARGLPTGSTYAGFEELRVNRRGQVLARVVLDHGSADRESALVRYTLDHRGRLHRAEALLVGDFLPSFRAFSIALNDHNGWIASVRSAKEPQGRILVDGAPVARVGDLSPLPGRHYTGLDSPVDLDHFGHFVFGAHVEGGTLLVRDGLVFVSSGEVLPALAPDPLGDLTLRAVRTADSGDVFWYADLPLQGDAFMRNREVLVRAGVTEIDGRRVISLGSGFTISPSGRYWCGGVELSDGHSALLFADLGASRGRDPRGTL